MDWGWRQMTVGNVNTEGVFKSRTSIQKELLRQNPMDSDGGGSVVQKTSDPR